MKNYSPDEEHEIPIREEEEEEQAGETRSEIIEVVGNKLVHLVKELFTSGNVLRIIIRSTEGKVLADVPVNTGLAIGGTIQIFYPFFGPILAIAWMWGKVKVEVVRPKDHTSSETEVREEIKRLMSGSEQGGEGE